jgi:hypothetical protein
MLFPEFDTGHDPGGKARFALLPGMDGAAEFSTDRVYRYWLSRDWGFRRFSDGREPFMLWIGMNPSTAEANVDDPTIRKELAFTRRMGFYRYIKVNVMDYRATSPRDLLGVKPCSERNLETIAHFAERAAAIVACWGKLHKTLIPHADNARLTLAGCPLNCLGTNNDGSPKHPLYLADSTKFQDYPTAEVTRK